MHDCSYISNQVTLSSHNGRQKRKGEREKLLSEGNFAIKRRNMHELAADTFIKATLTHAHNGYKGKVEKSRRSEELILLVHAQ